MEEDKAYNNPTPVAIAIVPVKIIMTYQLKTCNVAMKLMQVLYVRRNIQPKQGSLALPGGFVNTSERIETAGVRELFEETGLIVREEDFKLLASEITHNNRVMVFGVTPAREVNVMREVNENFKKSPQIREETQGFVMGGLNVENTAFPFHQKNIAKYFDEVNGNAVKESAMKGLSPNEVKELIARLKEDGYLSEGWILK